MVGIVAFAFGVPATILSNKQIAEIVSKEATVFKAPVYTQRDIELPFDLDVTYIEEKENEPPPTLRIARGAVKWAIDRELTQLLVVAAKPHLWRVNRDMEKARKEFGAHVELYVLDEQIERYGDTWYCRDSTQERVRSAKVWMKRERILKFMPFFLYKRIAS